jgi:ribosome-associated protein
MSSAEQPEKKSFKSISIPQVELEFTYARSSGAGGQNVNKVNSKAILRWHPASSYAMTAAVKDRFLNKFGGKLTNEGELILMSDVHRDQGRNAAECMDKLKEMIASVLTPPKKRKVTKPTFGSKMRRLKTKREHQEKKQGRRWKPE